jgi:hypothetical protein
MKLTMGDKNLNKMNAALSGSAAEYPIIANFLVNLRKNSCRYGLGRIFERFPL